MFTFAAAKTIGQNGFTNDQSDNGDKSISIGQYNAITKSILLTDIFVSHE